MVMAPLLFLDPDKMRRLWCAELWICMHVLQNNCAALFSYRLEALHTQQLFVAQQRAIPSQTCAAHQSTASSSSPTQPGCVHCV